MTGREPLDAETLAEGEYWERVYGPWEPWGPAETGAFFAGFDRPWWIIGGWSIEAATGPWREHEDLDASILACDVAALRAHVGDRWQLWNIADGTLRPLIDRWPDVQAPDSQLWVRRDATSPWVLDLPLTPDRDGLWTNKRLPEDDPLPVEDVVWTSDDGLPYLRPEITLLFKARLDRAKDRRDLEVTWPLLDTGRRGWLLDALARLDPEHAWLGLVSD